MKIAAKLQARRLRFQGKSLGAISKELKISKSTASLWCRDITLTNSQAEILLRLNRGGAGALANKIKRQKELLVIKMMAIRQYEKFNINSTERLKDLGVALYWAEGDKSLYVGVTNSDPELIKIMMLWFRVICKIPENRFRASIFYHSGQSEAAIKKYWSVITGIPLEQFGKSILKKEGTGHRKNILYNGTCKVRICNRNLLHTILTWISQLYIGKDGPVAQW